MRCRCASTVAWRCIGSARPCYASSGIRRWMCCSRSKASRPRSSTRSRRRASPGTAFFPSRCRISWPSSKPVRVRPPSSRDERVREDPHAAARSRARAVARPGTRAPPPGGAVDTARRHSRRARDARDRAGRRSPGRRRARGSRPRAGRGEPARLAWRVGSRGAPGRRARDRRARRGDRAGRAPRAHAATIAPPPPPHGPREAGDRRLAAGGEPLVAALDTLDGVATRVREASVLDKAAHAEWQEALRTAARRLEAAWLALETQVVDEHRRWADEIDAVPRWRPSLWPLVTLWTPLGVALVWLGLVLGGYLPAPAWLAARLGF